MLPSRSLDYLEDGCWVLMNFAAEDGGNYDDGLHFNGASDVDEGHHVDGGGKIDDEGFRFG